MTVETCEMCGADLSEGNAMDRERRILYDLTFTLVETRVEAEIKTCPRCQATTKGTFPDTMLGPLPYGLGLQADIITLLVAHMLFLRRAVALVAALCGRTLFEATCLGDIRLLHEALAPWEGAAITALLQRPALHADETGFRVKGKTQWLRVVTDWALTVRHVHPKRGRGAIEEIGIMPVYTGTLIHDCWTSSFADDQCTHQLCGSQLLRERALPIG